MKKLFILGVLVVAVAGGYIFATNAEKGTIKANVAENTKTTSTTLLAKQENNKETSKQVNNTSDKDNNLDKSSENKYGTEFSYKLSFKLNFVGSQADLEQYRSMITPTFKKLYSNDYSVEINIYRIYVSCENKNPTLTVLYTASYITDNHNLERTGIKAIPISVPDLAVTQSNPALPETWDYTSEPITIDGTTIPANTSYITLDDGSKAYYANMVFKNFNTPVMFYNSEEDARLNNDGIKVNNAYLRVTNINKTYAEVYDKSTGEIGFINLKDNPLISLDTQTRNNKIRKPLNSTPLQGIYNSTSFLAVDYKCKVKNKYQIVDLRKYPTIRSGVQATIQAGTNMIVIEQGNTWSLVADGNTLGWIPNKYILDEGAADEINTMDIAPRYTNPVGYSLNIDTNTKYNQDEVPYSTLIHALNVEFDRTGDKVTVSNLDPLIGMGHIGMAYNLTYTTPEGKTVTKNNIEIAGGTNSVTGGETNYYSQS